LALLFARVARFFSDSFLLCNNECAAPELQGSANPLLPTIQFVEEIFRFVLVTQSIQVVRRRRFGDFPVVNADGLPTLGHHAQEEHGTLRHNLALARLFAPAESWCACVNQLPFARLELFALRPVIVRDVRVSYRTPPELD
jgi:hypothetical protein